LLCSVTPLVWWWLGVLWLVGKSGLWKALSTRRPVLFL
jgi:hypothetical protein